MCIIAVKPANKPLWSENTIREMFRRNPDGAGIMFLRKDGKVRIHKGMMKVEEVLKYLYLHQPLLEKTDVVLHFRIATSGKKDELGCNPYPVWSHNNSKTKDVEMAMVHNGILDSYGWRGNAQINDTQVFIKETLRSLPHNFVKNKGIMELIEKSIGANKLVFLSKDGIKRVGRFIEDDGYYYSNDSYKSMYSTRTVYKNSHSNKTSEVDDLFAWTKPSSRKKDLTLDELDYMFTDNAYICDDEEEYEYIKEFFKRNKHMRFLPPERNEDALYYNDDYLYEFDNSLLMIHRLSLLQ